MKKFNLDKYDEFLDTSQIFLVGYGKKRQIETLIDCGNYMVEIELYDPYDCTREAGYVYDSNGVCISPGSWFGCQLYLEEE